MKPILRHLSFIFGTALLVWGLMDDSFVAQFLGVVLLGVFNVVLSSELGSSTPTQFED